MDWAWCSYQWKNVITITANGWSKLKQPTYNKKELDDGDSGEDARLGNLSRAAQCSSNMARPAVTNNKVSARLLAWPHAIGDECRGGSITLIFIKPSWSLRVIAHESWINNTKSLWTPFCSVACYEKLHNWFL